MAEFITDDGRKADKVCKEETLTDGSVVKVTELWVEPVLEKKLSKRVVEHTRPVVYRREIQTIDETTGQVKETQVEVAEGVDPTLTEKEHFVAPVNAGFVTREEMQQSIKDAVLLAVGADKKTPTTAKALVEQRQNATTGIDKNLLVVAGLWLVIAALSCGLFYMWHT